jgi:non-specific serine/threonine protein kinase
MTSGGTSGGADARRRLTPLPAEVTSFVGRADEHAQVALLLNDSRLITVAGPAGVGKSRLAVRAAAAAADGFPDGVCLIELSRVSDAGLLPDMIARQLGVLEKDPRPQLAAVLDLLRERRLLLILDTCDHLVSACGDFTATVLREAPGITVLATSRQPLDLPEEQLVRLGPLPVPGLDGVVPAGRGDAVDLFAQRAASAVPGFAVSAENLRDVIRLCQRLDGIPLAIELAAVRLRALPLAELVQRLESQFCVLTGGRRGSVPRHHTLQTAIEWSYEQCTRAERVLWQRLSVFAASFDLAGAQDVGGFGEIGPDQVATVLASLVDKSVVLPYQGGGGPGAGRASAGSSAGEVRYRLLEALREFGADRLAKIGRYAECRDRLIARYLRLAGEFDEQLTGDGQWTRLCRLRADHANIQAALDYGFADPATAPCAAELAAALAGYWYLAGALRVGVYWQDKVLSRFTEPTTERAGALVNRALLGAAQGLPDAIAQAREGIAMAARLGDAHTHARGYVALHLALALGGQYQEALDAAEAARRLLTQLNSRTALVCLDVQLGLMYQLSGDFAAAVRHCERALAGLAPGEQWLHSYLHVTAAIALYRLGQAAECGAAARAALLAKRAIGDRDGGSYALEVLAWLAADGGRHERAAMLLGAAQAQSEQPGNRLGGNATMEEFHQNAVRAVTASLGKTAYARLYAVGAASDIDWVVTIATTDNDTPAGYPANRPARTAATPGATGAGSTGPAGSATALTSREREIAGLVASGLSNRDIAARLVISKRTVDAHVNHIFAKLGLSSRVQLTLWLRDQVPRARPAELPTAARPL